MNFIDDKGEVDAKSFNRCTVVNETLQKRHVQIAHNTIDLLNKIQNAHLQTLEVRDRIVIIV